MNERVESWMVWRCGEKDDLLEDQVRERVMAIQAMGRGVAKLSGTVAEI